VTTFSVAIGQRPRYGNCIKSEFPLSRNAPAEPRYQPAIAEALERIMPPGLGPLVLFRTMARNPRIFAKLFAGGLLDKGTLSLRERELVIDRTTARLGCEYEWGVHVALFAERVGFGATEIAATVTGTADAECWSLSEEPLVALVDDLVDHCTIGDGTWEKLTAHFDEAQILEAIALVGYYHTISFLCNGLRLPYEPYAARFPVSRSPRPRRCDP
jgi:alkylhydroperoxidase family enzyme